MIQYNPRLTKAKQYLSIFLMGFIIVAFFIPWFRIDYPHHFSAYDINLEPYSYIDYYCHYDQEWFLIFTYLYSLIFSYLNIPIMATITLFFGITGNRNMLSMMIRITSIVTVLLCVIPDIIVFLELESADCFEFIGMIGDTEIDLGYFLIIGAAVVAFMLTFNSNSQVVSPIQGNAAINEVLSKIFTEYKSKEKLAYLGFGLIIFIGLLKQIIRSSSSAQFFSAIILIGISIFVYIKFPILLKNQEFNDEFYLITEQIGRLTGSLKWLNKFKKSMSIVTILTLVLIALVSLSNPQDRELTNLFAFVAGFSEHFLLLMVLIMLGKGELKEGGNIIIVLSIICLFRLIKDLFIASNYLNMNYGVKFLTFWTIGWYILLLVERRISSTHGNIQL